MLNFSVGYVIVLIFSSFSLLLYDWTEFQKNAFSTCKIGSKVQGASREKGQSVAHGGLRTTIEDAGFGFG